MREVDLLTRYTGIPERLRSVRPKSFELALGVLGLLDHIPAAALQTKLSPLKWVDLGSCRFEYVTALTAWLTQKRVEKVLPDWASLLGIEKVDRSLFEGLKSRKREALQEIALLPASLREKVSYQVQDQARFTESFDAAFWLFPYVRPAQYRLGGLWKSASLSELVNTAAARLTPGGLLIVFHLGESEWKAFKAAAPASVEVTTMFESERDSLYPTAAKVVVSVWRKKLDGQASRG